MATEVTKHVVVALPVDPEARNVLQAMAKTPIPPLDPDAALLPCEGCGEVLSVGANSQRMLTGMKGHVVLLCLFCTRQLPGAQTATIRALDGSEAFNG